MKHKITNLFISSLVLLAWFTTALAASVEISGSLQNVNGFALSGTITVIQEVPNLTFTTHHVGEDGLFQFTGNSQGELVLHASSPGYPPAEQVIGAGATGSITVNFTLPLGQDVDVRVVDAYGAAVPGAAVRVRYHEPDKPIRRVAFESEEVTDGDGRFVLRDVGIEIPFVVDVLAPKYVPVTSRLTKLSEGETEIEDISVGDLAATVVVEVLDAKGLFPLPDAQVMLLADPAGIAPKDRDSWLHHRAFRQSAVSSKLGNVQFSGVPAGNIVVRVKTSTGRGEQRAVAKPNEQTRVRVEVP